MCRWGGGGGGYVGRGGASGARRNQNLKKRGRDTYSGSVPIRLKFKRGLYIWNDGDTVTFVKR